MKKSNVMETQYTDLMRLTDLLKATVDSYRLLVASAAELNTVYHRRKKDVEDALDRASDIGHVIDEIIKVTKDYSDNYIDYSKLKNKVILTNYDKSYIKKEFEDVIQTEITNELNFQVQNKRDED